MANILDKEALIRLGWDGKTYYECGKPMLYNSAYKLWFCLNLLKCGKTKPS